MDSENIAKPPMPHTLRLNKFWEGSSSNPLQLPEKHTKKRAANINQNKNLNKIPWMVPLSRCIPVNYACFSVCFGTRKKKNTKLPLNSANMRSIHILYNKLLHICYEMF